ncbi:MAG: TonB-dependent receptor [Bacteroidetes bacterium]|nr:TonB-dependent receptor [Bacteroidota bacterium]
MKFTLTLLLSITYTSSFSQEIIKGTVYSLEKKNAPLIGASVVWQGTNNGTFTDSKGRFKINRDTASDTLVISYVGYETKKVHVGYNDWEVMTYLAPNGFLDKVVVLERADAATVDPNSAQLKISINRSELKKAACCNLSESFETNPSVDVSFSDAITGSKKIKMLGLDGIYSLITLENIPTVRGLSSAFGINAIPGSWIESIQLAKGIGSVVNGYESITGQINVELKKPTAIPSYYVNVYANHLGRFEITADHNLYFNEKWSTNLLVHGSAFMNNIDPNQDGFMDMPLRNQITAANRWQYYDGKKEAFLSISYLSDNTTGGDMRFTRGQEISLTNPYGVMIDQDRFDVSGKLGFIPPEEHENRSLGLIGSYSYYRQNAVYGLKDYYGVQQTGYFNAIFQDQLNNRYNLIKTGISLTADDYYEDFSDNLNAMDTLLTRTELVAGAFAEYTYDPNVRFSLIAGMRVDFHNMFGVIPTPRLHVRYKLSKDLSIRFAGGTGFRYPNVLIDNTRTMVSSRTLVIGKNLNPERAINAGASLVWDFLLRNEKGNITVDAFRTQFMNQVIMDMDANAFELRFYNLDGESFANVAQASIDYNINKRLAIRYAYKWQDVRATIDNQLQQQPFVAKNKMLFNVAYENKSGKWKFDATALRTDQARLPHSHTRPIEYQWPHETQAFYTLNSQVTRKTKWLEIYAGGENLNNFTQQDPIVAVESPFSQYFDAANVWAPIFGRMFYAGLRYSFVN